MTLVSLGFNGELTKIIFQLSLDTCMYLVLNVSKCTHSQKLLLSIVKMKGSTIE